jgi:4-amino-4-deoxy-L-arabinose transferase-like glycosyltransferase
LNRDALTECSRLAPFSIRILLILIVLLGVGVRVWGVAFDLPYIYHPDEPTNLGIIQTLYRTGDLNPHFFNYPSLFFYLHALLYVPYGQIAAWESSTAFQGVHTLVMGVTHAGIPRLILLHRLVTVGFGIGLVVVVWLIARTLFGRTETGLLAALFVALAPTVVNNSRMITPDIPATFFAALSVLGAAIVLRRDATWAYVLSGVAAGLTASTKYNGSLILISLAVAHFAAQGVRGFRDYRLYLAFALAGLAFAATTPFSILDFPAFWEDFTHEARHYSTGHPGMEGNTLSWYLQFLWKAMGPLAILAVIEIAQGVGTGDRETIMLAVFPVVYFAFINRFVVRNDRTILLLIPFLYLLAARFLASGWAWLNEWAGARHRWTAAGLGLVVLAVLLWTPVRMTATEIQTRTTAHARASARQWIQENVPPGSRIAMESYTAFVDPDQYDLLTVTRMIEHRPGWYEHRDVDYLVFGSGMYGRYFREPERYLGQKALYERLFRAFDLVAQFEDSRKEILIFRNLD